MHGGEREQARCASEGRAVQDKRDDERQQPDGGDRPVQGQLLVFEGRKGEHGKHEERHEAGRRDARDSSSRDLVQSLVLRGVPLGANRSGFGV